MPATLQVHQQPRPQVIHGEKMNPPIEIQAIIPSNSPGFTNIGNLTAMAAVYDNNDNPLQYHEYEGVWGTRAPGVQTVGGNKVVTFTFPDLKIDRLGTLYVRVAVHYTDAQGSVVLSSDDSWKFMVE
ncbi:uncharacterized protein C8A04DRAFT_29151 [Dichotomopilus funicola]|uniref:Uncharacterized protein n=1 Tax=Dichotomopilus funicola TaxID=1934379 RepID=A0AAN6ZKZ9_9PEZI|nr:hypothetical protein C8A04DRAFT_29151 [Dichotomopilus funicola]